MNPGEARPTGAFRAISGEAARARRRRGRWLALGLAGFALVVFAVSMARLGESAGNAAEVREWQK